jgi:hypothetical protein
MDTASHYKDFDGSAYGDRLIVYRNKWDGLWYGAYWMQQRNRTHYSSFYTTPLGYADPAWAAQEIERVFPKMPKVSLREVTHE